MHEPDVFAGRDGREYREQRNNDRFERKHLEASCDARRKIPAFLPGLKVEKKP